MSQDRQEEKADGAGENGNGAAVEAELVITPEERAELAEAEKAELKDKWLRALAELENYKKRTRREIDDNVFRAQQNLLNAFLPTVDNLGRALELARGNEQLHKGIQMVVNDFMSALGRFGVEPVPSVGHPFDPAIHEALQQIDTPDFPPGVVAREWEKGFRQGDRLLRPARVVIAGPGSTGGKAEGQAS
ncbi:molecular chaperone GrpE [Nannocystis exedens]|uniref:Protein GrpE n=1 Tax=Nannocystis exedens TaxID=54 RepID=A0A1I1WEH1_9BACT|nr:nucleotide exchange factor GrpE [Nannocystis exedens]PCC67612.1 nucleotide exchange factor GrpE [Nannocystis exedens]SFD92788.1 molecular chaperone GrpE [Nannocystis exedens]